MNKSIATLNLIVNIDILEGYLHTSYFVDALYVRVVHRGTLEMNLEKTNSYIFTSVQKNTFLYHKFPFVSSTLPNVNTKNVKNQTQFVSLNTTT